MSFRKTYAVFGLGRYGLAVAKELAAGGAEVLGVDSDEDIVNNAAEFLPVCKCADVTDPEVIERLGISDIDVVIVAMAGDLESSVMAVTLCKEAGVRRVIAKCANEMHMRILTRVGADSVVIPESESGVRMAKNLLSSGFVDVAELSRDFSMVEIEILPEWVGRSLSELDLRGKYSMNVAALKHADEVIVDIDPSKPLEKDTRLIVIADTEKLRKWYNKTH